MLFLMNDVILSLKPDGIKLPIDNQALSAMTLDQVGGLGAEMFAANPLLHRTDPYRCEKLATLINTKWPNINAALFVVPRVNCSPAQVTRYYVDVAFDVISNLSKRQLQGTLTTNLVDQEVWGRLAAA
jgi:hypothetical protein